MRDTMNNDNVIKFRPSLAFYHPNPRGRGSAVKMELYPAKVNSDGYILLVGANQSTDEYKFDWKEAICVRLGINDLSEMLRILRDDDGIVTDMAVYHKFRTQMTRISLKRLKYPSEGFALELVQNSSGQERAVRIIFSLTEACGIEASIAGALVYVSFGNPEAL